MLLRNGRAARDDGGRGGGGLRRLRLRRGVHVGGHLWGAGDIKQSAIILADSVRVPCS